MRTRRLLAATVGFFLLGALVTTAPAVASAPGVLTVPTLVYADPDGSILAQDLAGGASRVLLPEVEASTEVHYYMPSVSPDGTRIAVVRLTFTPTTGALTFRVATYSLATGAIVTSSTVWTSSFPDGLRWTPDGSWLYFSVFPMRATPVDAVWRWPTSGGAAVRVLAGANLDDISPSGAQLLVHVGVTATSAGVVRLRDQSTGSLAPLPGAASSWWGMWSPDGTRIALLSDGGAGVSISRIPSRGGTPTVVTSLAKALYPTWSPDGTALLVEDGTAIVRIDMATGAKTSLVSVDGANGHSVWGPAPSVDATVPAAATITAVSRSATGVTVGWTNPADADWTRTVVRRDGTIVAAGRITSAALTIPVSVAANLTVTTYDAFGNSGTAVPVVTAGVSTPSVNALTGVAAPFTVRWSAPGATAYTVRWTTMALTATGWKLQPWKAWLTGTTDTSAVFGAGSLPVRVVPGTTYYLAVTPAVAARTTTTVGTTATAYDQTAMAASSGWTMVRSTAVYLGSVATARAAGASRTFTVSANAFTLVGTRCASCGSVRIYLDGKLVRTVDTYSATTKVRQALWSSGSLGSIKRHVVKIVVVGTPHRPAVIIDAIAAKR